MFHLVPKYAQETPLDTLDVLTSIANALSGALGCGDSSLFEGEETRSGFYHMARALAENMGDMRDQWEEHLRSIESVLRERDQARAAAHEAEVRFMSLKAAVEYNDAERAREEAAAQVPDLTEPVPIPASSIAAAG